MKKRYLKEDWKKNLLLALALSAGGGLKAQIANKTPQEITQQPERSTGFYAAMVGAIEEFSEQMGSSKSFDEMVAIKEARQYYESLRDKKTPKQLSSTGQIVARNVLEALKKATPEKIQDLINKGKNLRTI